MQQYKALEEIVVWWSYLLYCPRGIDLTEVYLLRGRRILIKTQVSPTDLDLINGVGRILSGGAVEWLGVCSMKAGEGTGLYASQAILTTTLSALSSRAASSLRGLRELGVPGITMSLAALETTLRGCPSLQSLSCTFKMKDKSALSDLGQLLRTHGSGLHHLQAEVQGADILAFLPHLLICSALNLEGWTKGATLRECDAPLPTTSPTRQLVLTPVPLPGENGRLPHPYGWPQRVMNIVPRPCAIYHEIAPGSGYDKTAQGVKDRCETWHKIVSDCLRSSREPDSRNKTDRPGWTKRDREDQQL